MATLTSTGAVNLTSSTNWSPTQIPVAGDDLIIGAHTLTLDADMALNTIRFNNASSRLAISGTTRSVEATNGFQVNASIATIGVAAIPAGTTLTLTGQWICVINVNLSNMFTSTGGDLILRTVGSSQSAILFDGTQLTNGVWSICTSWTGGNLTTIGRFQIPSAVAGATLVTMSAGTWLHQSIGMNAFGLGGLRACNLSGTATLNWIGSVDTQTSQANGGFFTLSSSSTSTTIGQTGDTFCLRNAATATNSLTALVYITAGTVELVGMFSGRLDGLTIFAGAGTVNWRNQTYTIPATDHVGIYTFGGAVNLSGLALTTSTKVFVLELGSGTITVSSGTSITCTTTSAYAVGFGFTGLDDKIIILESSPPTLPAVQDVAAGEVYGYTASPLTGTGLIVDPAVLAAAMTTSLDTISTTSTARIADGVLTRNVSNVEATAGEHTLATVVLSMLEWEISGSDLIIKRTDGTTVHYTKTLSSASGGGNVITGLN